MLSAVCLYTSAVDNEIVQRTLSKCWLLFIAAAVWGRPGWGERRSGAVAARRGRGCGCDSGKESLSLQLDPLVWKACCNCLCCWGLSAELPPGSIYLHGVCFLEEKRKKRISLLENQLWRRNGDCLKMMKSSTWFRSNGLFVYDVNDFGGRVKAAFCCKCL